MAIARRLLLLLSVAPFAGCITAPEAAQCAATPFDVTGVSGDTVTTTTGLQYIEGAAGTGGALPWCRTVAVHYTGYLLDGTKFDSSRDIDRPLVFTPGLGTAIAGFEQGVIGMHTCGTRRLVIPPDLGYGAEPRRNAAGEIIIPASSTLIFDVEVLEIAGEPFAPCDSI
jgi:peptidylprolyl isomerase